MTEALASPRRLTTARRRHRLFAHRWHLLFLLPMLTLFLSFTLWPLGASIAYSFFDWNGYGALVDFVGLHNFRRVVNDPTFWRAFGQTFAFTFGNVVVGVPLALFLAILLNRPNLRARNVYRVLFFIPVVTTTAVVGVVFTILLNPLGGPVNDVLAAIGFSGRVGFLSERGLALPTVVAVDTWKGLGVVLVYWLAALQTIPAELYDAAAVDGATGWKRFRYVTLPMLVPLGVIIVLLSTVRSFDAFDLVQSMTGGGPNGGTEIVQTYIYRMAFAPEGIQPQYGYASAVSIVFGVAVMIIAVSQGALLSRIRGTRHARRSRASRTTQAAVSKAVKV